MSKLFRSKPSAKMAFPCDYSPMILNRLDMLLSAKYIFPITSDPISGGAILVKDDKIADIGDVASDYKCPYG